MPNVVINVTSTVGQAIAGLQSILGQVGGLTKGFSGLNSGLGRLGITLSSLFSARAIVRWTKDAIDAADEMQKMSQRIGIGVENLSRLAFAGDLAGTSLEELRIGTRGLSEWMVRTGQGGRDMLDVLLEQSDAFSSMADGAEKNRIAQQLFGRAGQQLIPLLNQGSAAIRAQMEEADRLGITIKSNTALAAEQFNDNLQRLNVAIRGVWLSIAEALLPSLVSFSESLIQAREQSSGLAQTIEFLGQFLRGVLVAFDLLWTILQSVATLIATNVYVQFTALAEISKALIKLAGLWFDSLKALGEGLMSMANKASTAAQILQAVLDKQYLHAALLAKELINDTGDDIDKLADRLEANTTAAFDTIVKAAANTWSNITGLGEDAADQLAKKWSNFWERSLGRFSTTTPPPRPAGSGLSGGAGANQQSEIELADARARRRLIETDPDLLRKQRKQALLPVMREEIGLIEEAIELNKERINDSSIDESARIQASKQLIALQTQRVELLREEQALMEEGFMGRLRDNLRTLIDEFTAFGENVADVLVNGVRKSIDTVADGIWAVVDGTATWGTLFQQVARSIISDLIRIVLQWIAGKLLMLAFEKLFGTVVQSATATQAATAAAAWGPAATLASIASYGAAAGIGLAAMATALGVGTAMGVGAGAAAGAAGSALAFAEGGITPNRATPAIIGERGAEFVVSNRGLRNVGQDFLEAINAGLIGAGGLANSIPASLAGNLPTAATTNAGPGAVAKSTMVIVVVDTMADALRAMESAGGESIIVNTTTRNRTEIGIPS